MDTQVALTVCGLRQVNPVLAVDVVRLCDWGPVEYHAGLALVEDVDIRFKAHGYLLSARRSSIATVTSVQPDARRDCSFILPFAQPQRGQHQ